VGPGHRGLEKNPVQIFLEYLKHRGCEAVVGKKYEKGVNMLETLSTSVYIHFLQQPLYIKAYQGFKTWKA